MWSSLLCWVVQWGELLIIYLGLSLGAPFNLMLPWIRVEELPNSYQCGIGKHFKLEEAYSNC